jgi:hypothetical protein
MARISTYPVDDNISGNDKLIGSEALTNLTKNYTVQKVGEFLRDRGVVTGGIQLVYSFQNDVTEYDNGQFMLSTSGGNAVAMSAITSIVINKAEIGGLDIEVLLRQMLTDNIAIYGADVKNTFGEYEAGAITENDTSLVVALTAVASNGSLVNGDRYYISKIPAAIASWGNITGTITNQTDLVNYITSRLPNVPFETIQEILDAMNDLSSIDFTAPVKIFGTDTAGDTISFTIPAPIEQLTSGALYAMVTAPDGTVQWREIGLAYNTSGNIEVNGGGF